MDHKFHVRPINPDSREEIALVATRMRQTLIEVLGEEEGGSMYTMEWLIDRVLWHLNPEHVAGAVYVAENPAGEIAGHTIVRVDDDGEGNPIGLFSTTYIDPTKRRAGIAKKLLNTGEMWMKEQGMTVAVTYTDKDNIKLQNLYQQRGYIMSPMENDFVKLERPLPTGDAHD